MPNPFCNRQKIRGWPQKVRELEQLEQAHTPLDLADLENSGWTSYELWISPFSNLVKRNPPGWYFRRYVDSMFRVMDQWEKELQARGDDFYLALWLFEPTQAMSQVVVATDHRIDFYRRRFLEKTNPGHFPPSVASLQQEHPWQLKWHLNDYWLEGDESPEEVARLRSLAIAEETHDDQTAFLLPAGDMWIHDRSQISSA